MCSIPPLGAYIKGTTNYVYPGIANKSEKYICPDCSKDLILRKGKIRVHHFAHAKSDNPCSYYDKPSEGQIHKDAKMLLKTVLESGKQLTIFWHCTSEECPEESDEYEIPIVSDTSSIRLEYRFNHNGLKIADVAYIDNNEIVCLFEILNTHKTASDARPEPWFEIDARKLINAVNNNEEYITVQCMRDKSCKLCKLVACKRCNYMTPMWVMNTNVINDICKSCDIEWYNVIHLEVPFAEKEKVKAYGGRFDQFYKKWYITESNNQKYHILKR